MKTLDIDYVDEVVEAIIDDFSEKLQKQEERIDYLQDIIEEQSFTMRNLRNEG